MLYTQMLISNFYYMNAHPLLPLHPFLPLEPAYAGRDGAGNLYNDWRPPTVGEILTAIEHEDHEDGLLDVFDFSYRADDQGPDAIMDAGEIPYQEAYFWTACHYRRKGLSNLYKVRFGNGGAIGVDVILQSGSGWLIAVRGKPADHSNCPKDHAAAFVPNPECQLSIGDVALKEGSDGDSFFTFTVTRRGDLNFPLVIIYWTEDVPGGALAGEEGDPDADYESVSGMQVCGAGWSDLRIAVRVYGDSEREPNETFLLNILDVTSVIEGVPTVTVIESQGVGTIRNDDRK
jgi:hypothetical protein